MSNLARAGSAGFLPTYAAAAAKEMLACQAELKEQIWGSTFIGHCFEPEVEDLGLETLCDLKGQTDDHSPSLKTVVLPPPVNIVSRSASFQEELA